MTIHLTQADPLVSNGFNFVCYSKFEIAFAFDAIEIIVLDQADLLQESIILTIKGILLRPEIRSISS